MPTTAQQFTLFEMPADETPKVKSKWAEFQEMRRLNADEVNTGGLVPLNVAPVLLDVHHSRVGKLIEDGRFRRWDFFGRGFVCVNDLAAYMNSERKSGRPMKDPPITLKATYRRMKEQSGKKP